MMIRVNHELPGWPQVLARAVESFGDAGCGAALDLYHPDFARADIDDQV